MRAVANSTLARLGTFRAPLKRFLDYQDETLRLGDLYVTGASRMRGAYNLAKARSDVERHLGTLDEEANRAELEREQELADLATVESEGGFRLLNAHLLVGVWGVFESTIDDFVIGWMASRPTDVASDSCGEVKLPPAAVFDPDVRNRAEVFLDALKKRRGLPLARGVNRFEDTLALVGVDGPLPSGLADVFFEMQQVRNVYAHSGGIVDGRFAEALASLPLTIGEVVPITRHTAADYYGCLAEYIVIIVKRSWARLGILYDSAGNYYWRRGLSAADVLDHLPVTHEPGTPLANHFARGRSEHA